MTPPRSDGLIPRLVRAPPVVSIVLDLPAGRLRIGDRPVELRPKTWEVLCTLAERPGELVTKSELLDRVWPDTAVSEGILNKSIGELRVALDDSRDATSCIETVPRRGYRWIGTARIVARSATMPVAGTAVRTGRADVLSTAIVARSDEIARLESALARARAGRRQVLFITGEAGAGKTTMVEHLLDRIAGPEGEGLRVVHGQCLETSGPHEPYLPLLDGLERLARDETWGDSVAAVLRLCAPTWIAQMPALAMPAAASPAPGSMLRELATAIDELAREATLVLVLEDAHWADLATTEAIAALAKRRDAARLLLIVTKRKAEALATEHPIVAVTRDLLSRGATEEIALAPFGGEDLTAYLCARCPGLDAHGEIVDWLLQQTAGNPLFVRLVLDDWISRGMVAPSQDGAWTPAGDPAEMRQTVPDSLRALLERQIARLVPEERSALEAASVRVGLFHAASIAAAAAIDPEEADALFERIARRGQLLRACAVSADATGHRHEQYAFLHATVQNVVAAGLPSARRRRLHLAAAEQLQREHGGRTSSICALLAVHYEAAGDPARAVVHLRESARQAMLRDAPGDAIAILESALELIDSSPGLSDPEADRVLVLRYLSHARQLAYGFVDSQVAELWARTSELAAASENAPERIFADAGRIVVACVSGRYAEAEEFIRAALPLMDVIDDVGARKTFFFAAGTTRYRIAAMSDARSMFETALAIEHPSQPVPGADITALLMSQYSPAVALSGRPDEVRRLAKASMERARALSHYSECVTATLVAWALALVGDYEEATPIAARALEIAEADNFHTWSTRPLVVLGLAAMRDGRLDDGIAKIRTGLEGRKSDGQVVDHSAMCCLFAEAMFDAGRPGGDAILDEAADFVASSGELYAESEIFRLRAKSMWRAGADTTDVESLLRRALELAELRGIHWHAMLAATDLANLLAGTRGAAEASRALRSALERIEGGIQLEAVARAREALERCGATAKIA